MCSQKVDVAEPVPDGGGAAAAPGTPPALKVPGVALDLAICGTLAILGVWFVVEASGLRGGRAAFGPGTWPAITGGCLAVLALVQAGLSFARRRNLEPVGVQRPLWLMLAMVMVVLFPSAIERLGYYPVAVIWVPVFGWIAGIRNPLGLAAATVIVLALAKLVFELLLGTPLP